MLIIPYQFYNEENVKKFLKDIGVSKEAWDILAPKSVFFAFRVKNIRSWAANIIKQYMLSLGTDAALNRKVLIKNVNSDILIFGSLSQLKKLCLRLKEQPFGLDKLSQFLSDTISNYLKNEFAIEIRGKKIIISKPLICGIINITDDSFSGDGILRYSRDWNIVKNKVFEKVKEMVDAGASIIDIGAQSSRPFSSPIKEKEEVARIGPVVKFIRRNFKNILISVDTYRYNTAKVALDEGADIINDITALRHSSQMVSLIKEYDAGCVLMHMKGTPKTMQIKPVYKKGVIEELITFFDKRISFCEQNGISKFQLFIDPGIGFGKTVEQNLKIINGLDKFKIFGLPIFLGISRKSFIGKILHLEVKERLVGTIASEVVSILKGAKILRVHDVKETYEAIKMVNCITAYN